MNTISYLKEVYGYGVPIFLKDIRIGGKSKVSIRKDLSRGVEDGKIIRKTQGVYCFKEENEFSDSVSFRDIITAKYIKDDFGIPGLDLEIFGYYTGLSFMHSLGLTQQVPAVLEIVTNNTSCKREYKIKNRSVKLIKPKTTINRFNYKILQFLDLFYLIDKDEIKENKVTLRKYISNNLSKADLEKYLGLYPARIINLILNGGLFDAFR